MAIIDSGEYYYDEYSNPIGQYGYAFTYTPATGFQGTDSFSYSLNDDEGGGSATVTIRVGQPQSNSDYYWAIMESPLTVVAASGVLANDADPDGDTLTAYKVADVANGDLTLNPNGSFLYTPDPGYVGWDSFTYILDDGHWQTESTIVWIEVLAPLGANDDSYVAAQDTPLFLPSPGVLHNDADPNGGSLNVNHVVGPANGTLEWNPFGGFLYTPNPEFFGTDTFIYYAINAASMIDEATVTIEVLPIGNGLLANNDSGSAFSMLAGEPLEVAAPGVLANDTNPSNHPLTAILISYPTDGTLDFRPDGSFDYQPDVGFVGTDTFTYRFTDGVNASTLGTVTLNVYETPDIAVTRFYSDGATLQLQYAVLGTADMPCWERPICRAGNGRCTFHGHVVRSVRRPDARPGTAKLCNRCRV